MAQNVISEREILEFERPIIDLERKIEELRDLSTNSVDFSSEIEKLESKAIKLQREVFADLTPEQKVQLSRHPRRPYTLDYVRLLMDEFVELHGDRSFADDPALVCGMANFAGFEVLLVGHQKGRNTKENLHRNFGMARPEGYRKSVRLMKMAARFGRPIICLIDTPGAYPGIGAEERGQAEAIAYSLQAMSSLPVPIIATVIGEGGSGGALAIGVADCVLMMEYAIYSVITPEGCASILWRDPAKAGEAARQLKLTASDLLELKIIDGLVSEPPGGAHRKHSIAARSLGEALLENLVSLSALSTDELLERRYQKFRSLGAFESDG